MDAEIEKEYRWHMLPYFILILLLSFSLFVFSGCSDRGRVLEQEKIHTIRIATDYRETDFGYQQLSIFAQNLFELSNGTMKVQIYKTNEWSKEESFIEYINCESLEIACVSMSQVALLQPMYEVYEQAYLFDDLQVVENYILGSAVQSALKLLPSSYYGIGMIADGYSYLIHDKLYLDLSYGTVKHLADIHELNGVVIYDAQANYRLHPLITSSKWWNTLTELEQTWIRESFKISLERILECQEDLILQQTAENEIMVQSMLSAELSDYKEQQISQREAYFASHSDAITVYWRTKVMETIIGEEI